MAAPTNLQTVLEDVEQARAWALGHFNTDTEHSGLLDLPAFDIEFEADQMTVFPVSYGERLMGIRYRLKWLAGQVGWEGYNPFTNTPFTWLDCGKALGPPEEHHRIRT